jgi:hypothetical protein
MPETIATPAPKPEPGLDPQEASIACAIPCLRSPAGGAISTSWPVPLKPPAGKLIYSAQAALSALPREPKTAAKNKKNTPYPRGNSKVNKVFSILNISKQVS